jgi:hypothetical protein
MRTWCQLMAQIRRGDVGAVLFEETIHPVLSGAMALRAGETDHVRLGRNRGENSCRAACQGAVAVDGSAETGATVIQGAVTPISSPSMKTLASIRPGRSSRN